MLEEPMKVNKMMLGNRLVFPPMATERSDRGSVTDEMVRYYADRAGRIGLMITEHSFVSQEGLASPGQMSVASDGCIPGLRRIADAVHAKGTTKLMCQINHAGLQAKPRPYEVGGQEDIDRLKDCFVRSALRAKKAGFDGVEIHAAHGYLLDQFYSPLTNRRTDMYCGNTMEGRTRLTAEIISEVRKAVGPDYPVALRFGASDFMPGGATIEEAPIAARIYEEAGIDMIDVSGGMNGYVIRGDRTPGWFSGLSKAVRSAVDVPVMVTGGIRDKATAERILSEGCADLIGVGRPIYRDPAAIGTFI